MKRRMKKTIAVIVVFFLIIIVSICCVRHFFKQQLKKWEKNRVFSMVEENEEELTKLIDAINIEDLSKIIYRYDINDDIRIYYKNLENPEINKAFEDYRLLSIKSALNSEGYLRFTINSILDIVLYEENTDYLFGFYYSDDDTPRDIKGEVCDLEYERENGDVRHSYRTEKIIDHWWYYEREREDMRVFEKPQNIFN